jgi:hypothetical protein
MALRVERAMWLPKYLIETTHFSIYEVLYFDCVLGSKTRTAEHLYVLCLVGHDIQGVRQNFFE